MGPSHGAAALVVCAECGRESDDPTGWHVDRIDDPTDEDERPQLGFYCPKCAAREFGRLLRSNRMADRGIDRVRVALSGETVELSWESRQALLQECREFDWREGSPIVERLRTVADAFERAGTSRPVELGPEKRTLRMVLQSLESSGPDEMPSDLLALLNALEADLDDGSDVAELPTDLGELLNAVRWLEDRVGQEIRVELLFTRDRERRIEGGFQGDGALSRRSGGRYAVGKSMSFNPTGLGASVGRLTDDDLVLEVADGAYLHLMVQGSSPTSFSPIR